MSIPIEIPETLSRNKKWTDWLAQLPDILAACEKKWDLRIEAPMKEEYAEMSYGYITPATQLDGTEVVLKIVPPGIIAELKERQALQLCDGDSTIKLLGYDETLGTIMLERARPGVPLSVNTDDEENTRIASRLMKKFWKPLPPKHNFVPADYEIEGFDRLRKKHNGTTGIFPEKWAKRAETLYKELMESSTETVMLHADLHHYNILSATREPYLAIDPKGYYGDPGYEVGAFLANYPEESCEGKDRNEIDISRINIMIEELEMPRDRVIKWGVVLSCIWSKWGVSDTNSGWRDALRRAETLDSLL
ncbi:MAG: aminoglycoside phosphotransferase family protein [Candidatus Latescibacteria bacterium]|jgi:streptomycin 6-kinase|nr:aminoglycoside phosphotransferase family protein [Candidatus Latescibacterota bacterium]